MARHFARRAATRFGLSVVLPTSADIRLLTVYDWPGNTRELAAIMDRAAILGNGTRLEVSKALGVTASVSASPKVAMKSWAKANQSVSSIPSLSEAIKTHIEAALSLSQGRVEGKAGAADLLQVNPNTLRAKMRKLQIHGARFRC